jgi:hypothetical protein
MESREVHTGFCREDLRERDHLEDHGINGNIILSWIFRNWDGEAQTEFIWFSIGTNIGFL